MDGISNVRKGSAPPVLNTRTNNGNNVNPSSKSHADTVRTHISDNMYQDRVNSLTAKTNKLINRHKTAQVKYFIKGYWQPFGHVFQRIYSPLDIEF